MLTRLRLLGIAALAALAATQTAQPFAQQVAALSEREGYFDTDNLISNESSYLQVLPELKRRNTNGGVYIGVGPDQNFTYIAATRPSLAYIVDIRRDNVLLHLLFKALFQRARTRVDYLALLFGRPVPTDTDAWRQASIDRLVRYVEDNKRTDTAALDSRLEGAIRGFGVPLSADDMKTIGRFHERFMEAGLSLQFQTAGRAPQWNYPTYRMLLLDTDSTGRHGNFLASEDAFQFLKDLQAHDRVIPVVGDLSGPSALVNISKAMTAHGDRLSTFYVSNVEFYLSRAGTLGKFVANLRQLPRGDGAVLIRSLFGRFEAVPARPGDVSVSRLEPIDAYLARADLTPR